MDSIVTKAGSRRACVTLTYKEEKRRVEEWEKRGVSAYERRDRRIEVFEIQLQIYTDTTTGKNLWQFVIETTMNKPKRVMAAIANALDAVNIDNKVKWTFIPWQKPAAYDEHLDVSNISYDYYTRKIGIQAEDSFYCSPYEKSTI